MSDCAKLGLTISVIHVIHRGKIRFVSRPPSIDSLVVMVQDRTHYCLCVHTFITVVLHKSPETSELNLRCGLGKIAGVQTFP
jgi:hypothetical protein